MQRLLIEGFSLMFYFKQIFLVDCEKDDTNLYLNLPLGVFLMGRKMEDWSNGGSNGGQRRILVTGAARSGKSEWAEFLAHQAETAGQQVVYVATAQLNPEDPEWQRRITQHQQRRPSRWQTLSVPVDLAATLYQATSDQCLLVDSLGTWLANLLDQDETAWKQTQQQLLTRFQNCAADVIVVGEETGWGVVPAYPLGRSFRDRLGSLIRHLGQLANPVYLVTGGHALNLSQLGTPLPSFAHFPASHQVEEGHADGDSTGDLLGD